MSAYKCLVSLAVLVVALLTINTVPINGVPYAFANKSHNMTVGNRMPGDRLVLKENVVKNSGWLKIQIVEKNFTISKWERITMVEALDQQTNGNGAYASIMNGGPGWNNVSMRFKSQRGHGINFVVQIYAR